MAGDSATCAAGQDLASVGRGLAERCDQAAVRPLVDEGADEGSFSERVPDRQPAEDVAQ